MWSLVCAGHYLLGRSVEMWSLVYVGHYLLGRSVQIQLLVYVGHYLLGWSVQMWSLVSGPGVLSSSAGSHACQSIQLRRK